MEDKELVELQKEALKKQIEREERLSNNRRSSSQAILFCLFFGAVSLIPLVFKEMFAGTPEALSRITCAFIRENCAFIRENCEDNNK